MFDAAMAFFASLGFGILFQIRGKKLLWAGLVGMIGGIVYCLALFYFDIIISLLITSTIITILAEILARLLKCPSTIFVICALMPFVPGGGMYQTMLALVKNDFELALTYGLSTIAQAGAIVLGSIFVFSLFKAYMNAKKYYF